MNTNPNPKTAPDTSADAPAASDALATPGDAMITATFDAAVPPTKPVHSAGPHAGRYRLDECLGKGGFGEVWKGHDPILDIAVAIKMPRSDRAFTPAEIDRFVEEARKQARLNHPAIVKIRHAERDGSSWLIVSDFIDGMSLRERMGKSRLGHAEAARLVADIADALHAAHRQRLIHRDVKPANILVDRADRPYLTDFGLALSEDEQQRERDTVSGTYAYMSPEQIRGETHFLDGRSDIYSLGVVLYELLTNERPFRGIAFEEYREQVLSRPPKPPRAIDESIPKELERICLKCLAKSVHERFTTAADLAAELRATAKPRSRMHLPVLIGLGAICMAAVVAVTRPWADTPGLVIVPVPKVEPKTDPGVLPVSRNGLIALWERTPKKLVWPGRPGALLDVKDESIWAVCTGHGLIKLGEVNEPDYTFRVNVQMLTRNASFGIVLGHHYAIEGGRDQSHFAFFRLSPGLPGAKSKYALAHYAIAYNEAAGGTPTGNVISTARIDDLPSREIPLEIVIMAEKLAEVKWDGRTLPEIMKPPIRTKVRTWKGGICIYVSDGSFQFHRPIVELKSSKT